MSEERFDYSGERQRHEKFVGRAALLARLDQLLIASDTDRWVVVTGGPGMGKSALLAAWLARREAAGAVVRITSFAAASTTGAIPRSSSARWWHRARSIFPDLRERDVDERMHPASRLARMLKRVSENALKPRWERMVVLIDGLDEYDPPGPATGGPLAAFLPHALPPGVSFLYASRPRPLYVSSLEARDGELVQIDLDDPSSAADNDATVRAVWERAAKPLGLDARFVEQAVARAAQLSAFVDRAAQLSTTIERLFSTGDALERSDRPYETPRSSCGSDRHLGNEASVMAVARDHRTTRAERRRRHPAVRSGVRAPLQALQLACPCRLI